MQDIATKSRSVDELVGEIAVASSEQTQGIEQVNRAVSQMDQVVQATAAQAEEGASVANELTTQSESLRTCVVNLAEIVGSGRAAPAEKIVATQAVVNPVAVQAKGTKRLTRRQEADQEALSFK